MPYVPGAIAARIEIDYPGGRCVFGMVEQLQSDAAGVAAENCEVNAASHFLGSQGQRRTGLNVGVPRGLRDVTAQLAWSRFHHRCHRIGAASKGTATSEWCGITRAV